MATATLTPSSLPGDVRLMNATAALLALVGSAALAAALLVWVAKQPTFAIRSIRLDGEITRNSISTIRANATPHLAGHFFSIDLGEARRAFEAVPWVRHAVVRRVWPNRLMVTLEEHHPAALWETDGGAEKLVNSFGEVFQANPGDVEDEALPTLTGPDGSSARLLTLLQRLQPVLVPLDAAIERLEMSGRGSLRAELDSGAEIEIGRGSDDEIVERMQRFVGTVGQVIAQHQRPLVHADLRHNDGYAVRLKGITTTVSPTPGRK
ncbi:MAG: cell division protein FtsQ/DivIB [Piscinibacter sp.]|nr:cell division protein FtsQ/DivIB [Piscinibacter sp.]